MVPLSFGVWTCYDLFLYTDLSVDCIRDKDFIFLSDGGLYVEFVYEFHVLPSTTLVFNLQLKKLYISG